VGGQVALQLALEQPERVSKIVLVGATPRFVQGGGWREAIKQKVLDDFGEALIRSRESTIGRFITLQMLGVKGGRQWLQELKQSLAEPPLPGTLEAGLRILNETDLRPMLSAIQQPTHWIMGERDQLVPPSAAEYAAEQMRQSSVVRVAGAAHAPFLSHPGLFLQEVSQFGQ